MAKQKCVIVLGLPRSGTTLISTAIGCHEEICMLDEDFFLSVSRITGGKLPAVKLCIPNHVQMRRKWKLWWQPVRWNGFLRKRLHYTLPRSLFSIEDYLQHYDCRFICILREPRKTLSALDNRGHTKLKKALKAARHAYDIYEELYARMPEQVAFISFDAFLSDPDAQNKALCDFIGVNYSDAMLEAPNKNERYKGQKFDTSKVGAEDYDEASLDSGTQALVKRYTELKQHVI